VTFATVGRVVRFRQNEVLRGSAGDVSGPYGFRCECADSQCRELVLVDAADVYSIRANPRRLVMALGHKTDSERIVLTYDRYIIVELR
jgi:hypothetical protein